MSEEINSIKDAIKERLSNPFYGKFIIAWSLWNWKVFYLTLFVDEKNLETKNKLKEVSNYLELNSFSDVFEIHIIPIVITVFLIWGFPYITHGAYKSSEKFRKKKALTKKNTDEEIMNFREKEIESLNKRIMMRDHDVNRYRLMCEYLNQDRLLLDKSKIGFYRKVFREKVLMNPNKDKVYLVIDNYNKSRNHEDYIKELDIVEKEFMIDNLLIKKNDDNNRYSLSEFGVFVSKHRLFDKHRYLESVKDYINFDLG